MRAVQHTPGPLTVCEEKRPVDGPRITVHASNGMVLAELDGYNNVERRALATLFAAAPDLLDALVEVMDAVKVFHGPVEWETYRDHSPEMKRWRAAIAKAEGRTS